MKHLKSYENNNIKKGMYITFPYNIKNTEKRGQYRTIAFKPYEISRAISDEFSIIGETDGEDLWIDNKDPDVIFLPDNFTDEYIDMLKKSFKYNI